MIKIAEGHSEIVIADMELTRASSRRASLSVRLKRRPLARSADQEGQMNAQANDFPTGVFVHETRPIWTLQFNDDGSYAFRVNDVVDATGTYTINGDRYTEDTDYPPCRQARTATYRFCYDHGRLVFHLVGEDNCAERRASLDGVTWFRQE